MNTNIEVTFVDGETAVVTFGLVSKEVIDLVLRAWALLYQREVQDWQTTAEPADYWYDALLPIGASVLRSLRRKSLLLAAA